MHTINDPLLEGHELGSRRCTRCTDGFPRPCLHCRGLVHGELEHIEGDGDMLVSECELCHRRPD